MLRRGNRGSGRACFALACVLVGTGLGCSLFRFGQEKSEVEQMVSWLSGSISSERSSDAPVVVVAFEVREGQALMLDDPVIVYGGGRYRTVVQSGEYLIGAFEDVDGDLVLGPGERWSFHGDGQTIRAQGNTNGLDIVVPATAAPLSELPSELSGSLENGTVELPLHSIGDVVGLDDPKLSREVGLLGQWEPLKYFERSRAGIYFLEEYDPRKTPVLMIHGIGGSPAEFSTLIEGRPGDDDGPGWAGLDRSRYQPWLVSYPSSFPLTIVADSLQLWVNLADAKFGPETILMVAHSMGGLAARAFVNEHLERGRGEELGALVTIGTPWGGNPDASKGLVMSPIVVWSWRDIATGSPFLATLFDTPLPEHLPFHLIFAYPHQEPGATTLPSGDGVIDFNSLVERRAFQEATSVHVLEGDHTSILHSPELVAELGVILDGAVRTRR